MAHAYASSCKSHLFAYWLNETHLTFGNFGTTKYADWDSFNKRMAWFLSLVNAVSSMATGFYAAFCDTLPHWKLAIHQTPNRNQFAGFVEGLQCAVATLLKAFQHCFYSRNICCTLWIREITFKGFAQIYCASSIGNLYSAAWLFPGFRISLVIIWRRCPNDMKISVRHLWHVRALRKTPLSPSYFFRNGLYFSIAED